jgi:hypothetical protein
MGWITSSRLNAYKPLIPIPVVWRDRSATPDKWKLLGEQPDIAILNMKHYNSADIVTIGADDWMVFPWTRKRYTAGGAINTDESWNAGVAYKKFA